MKMNGEENNQQDLRSELQQVMAETENAKKRIEQISSQLEMLEEASSEIQSTLQGIEALDNAEPGDEVFMPLGAGSFIKGTLKDKENVIVGAGAGVSIEQDREDAKETLEDRKEKVQDEMQNLRKMLQDTQQRQQQLNQRYEQLVRQAQQSQGY